MESELTRPIIGIENRTAQEVFGIMCDRITGSRPTPPAYKPAQSVEVSDEDIAACADHFRIEGARRMQEACVADALTWFPANTVDTIKAGGVVQSLRELDAEVIARGYK